MDKLLTRLRCFTEDGRSATRGDARALQAVLEEEYPGGEGFPDPALYEDLEVAAACYRPGGGEFMYDEEQMATICRQALLLLERK